MPNGVAIMNELTVRENSIIVNVKQCLTCGVKIIPKSKRQENNNYCSKYCYESRGGRGRDSLSYALVNMRQRCYNPNHPDFHNYDGRGITICDEWNNSLDAFVAWSRANGWQPGLTIDRWPDKNGNYEPSNCRWTTMIKQNRNTRQNVMISAFGETKTAVEWAGDERCTVSHRVLLQRIGMGVNSEIAITLNTLRGGNYCKIPDEDIAAIKLRVSRGESYKSIASDYNVNRGTIKNVLTRPRINGSRRLLT
jgi:hypothetical protein